MASPCKITYNGIEYTYDEFAALLYEGKIEEAKDILSETVPEISEKIGGERMFSAKNKFIEERRKELGLEPVFKNLKQRDEQLFDKVAEVVARDKNDVNSVPKLVRRATESGRFLFLPEEQLAIARERDILDEDLTKLDKEILDGKDVKEERILKQAEINEYDIALTNMGTVSGQMLRARQFFMNKSLTRRTILNRMEADSKTGKLPDSQKKLVEDAFAEKEKTDKEVADLQKELDDVNAELAKLRSIQEKIEETKGKAKTEKKKSRDDVKKNIADIKNRLQLKQNARKGGPIKMGASLETLEAFAEDAPLITELALEHVRLGIIDAKALVNVVYDEVKDIYDGITKRDVQDAISGYGKQKEKRVETDEVKLLRELKNQLRLFSGIEDVTQRGELPKKTGFVRDEQTPAVRLLRQELAREIKKAGLDVDINADPKKLRSALEKVKTQIRNQIEILNAEKASGERIRNIKSPLIADAILLDLKSERDALMAAVDLILEQKGVIAKEELAKNKKQLEKKIDELVHVIQTGKDITKKDKLKLSDTELKQLQKTYNGLKDTYDKYYNEKYPDAEITKKLTATIDKTNSRIAEKEKAIAEMNMDKLLVKKKEPLDISKLSDKEKELRKKLDDARLREAVVNNRILEIREDWRLSQRTDLERFIDLVDDVTRENSISGLSAIPKIGSSGVAVQLLQGISNAIGYGTAKFLPEVAKKARFEGKFDLSIEFNAMKEYFNSESWKEAAEGFKTGKHREDKLYSYEKHREYNIKVPLPNGKTATINPFVFGRLHKLSKTPSYKVAYKRAVLYLTKDAIKDPKNFEEVGGKLILKQDVIKEIEQSAYEEGKRQVFLQPNALAKLIRKGISSVERVDSKAAKVLATALKFQFQILNVGLNFYEQQLSYVPGLNHVRALFDNAVGEKKSYVQLKLKNAMSEMTPKQSDFVLRNLKTGNIGIALMFMGYFLPDMFGGFNTEREDNDELIRGDVKVGSYRLPHWATHIPIFYVMQLGATFRRYADSDSEEATKVAFDAVKSAIEANPFNYTSGSVSRALQSEKGASQFMFDQTVGRLEPQLFNEIARELDLDEETHHPTMRYPKNWYEMAKMKIPGLREDVSTEKEKKENKDSYKIKW